MAWELINTNPFKDIEKVRSEWDKLWDTFYWGRPPERSYAGEEEWQPLIDVAETGSELIINVEIPGVDPKDIDVSLGEGTLLSKGRKSRKRKGKKRTISSWRETTELLPAQSVFLWKSRAIRSVPRIRTGS